MNNENVHGGRVPSSHDLCVKAVIKAASFGEKSPLGLSPFSPDSNQINKQTKKVVLKGRPTKSPGTKTGPLPLHQNLQKYVAAMNSLTSTSWGARKDACGALSRLIKNEKPPCDNIINVTRLIQHLQPAIALQLEENHSLVIKSVCILITTLCTKYPILSKQLAEHVVVKLLRLSQSAHKSFAIPTKEALTCIAKHLDLNPLLVCNLFHESKGEKLRHGCVDYFFQSLKACPSASPLSPRTIESFVHFIPAGMADSNESIRKTSRNLFATFAAKCEEGALQIFNSLSPKTKSLLLLENESLRANFEMPKHTPSVSSVAKNSRDSDRRRKELSLWQLQKSEEKSAEVHNGLMNHGRRVTKLADKKQITPSVDSASSSASQKKQQSIQAAARSATRMLRSKRSLFREDSKLNKDFQFHDVVFKIPSPTVMVEHVEVSPLRVESDPNPGLIPSPTVMVEHVEVSPLRVESDPNPGLPDHTNESSGSPSIQPEKTTNNVDFVKCDLSSPADIALFTSQNDEELFKVECNHYFDEQAETKVPVIDRDEPRMIQPNSVTADVKSTPQTEVSILSSVVSSPSMSPPCNGQSALQLQLENLKREIDHLTETQDEAEEAMDSAVKLRRITRLNLEISPCPVDISMTTDTCHNHLGSTEKKLLSPPADILITKTCQEHVGSATKKRFGSGIDFSFENESTANIHRKNLPLDFSTKTIFSGGPTIKTSTTVLTAIIVDLTIMISLVGIFCLVVFLNPSFVFSHLRDFIFCGTTKTLLLLHEFTIPWNGFAQLLLFQLRGFMFSNNDNILSIVEHSKNPVGKLMAPLLLQESAFTVFIDKEKHAQIDRLRGLDFSATVGTYHQFSHGSVIQFSHHVDLSHFCLDAISPVQKVSIVRLEKEFLRQTSHFLGGTKNENAQFAFENLVPIVSVGNAVDLTSFVVVPDNVRSSRILPQAIDGDDCFPLLTTAEDVIDGNALCFNAATMAFMQSSASKGEPALHEDLSDGRNSPAFLVNEVVSILDLRKEALRQESSILGEGRTHLPNLLSNLIGVIQTDLGVDLSSFHTSSLGNVVAPVSPLNIYDAMKEQTASFFRVETNLYSSHPLLTTPVVSTGNAVDLSRFVEVNEEDLTHAIHKEPPIHELDNDDSITFVTVVVGAIGSAIVGMLISFNIMEANIDKEVVECDADNIATSAPLEGPYNAVHVIKSQSGTVFTPVRRSKRIKKGHVYSQKKQEDVAEFDFEVTPSQARQLLRAGITKQ
jgi:hypothetical protein